MFDFAKLGWAPSAVGNVVRYDQNLSKKRAWGRFYGTVGGALIASIVLVFIDNITAVVWAGAAFAVINGLLKKTKLGMIPLFYTATILLLYSANNLSSSGLITIQRVLYNLIGIVYPFPILMKKINPKTKTN